MKTYSTDNSKAIRANMRAISEMLNRYEAAHKAQDNVRTCVEYDGCQDVMRESYREIIRQMKAMLNTINMMGCSCEALEIEDVLTIETSKLF